MPCHDCGFWKRPHAYEPANKARQMGSCEHDGRGAAASYHCPHWQQRRVQHAEVGLTQAEVAYARRNPHNPHVKALNTLFRQIEGRPNDDALRQEFAERLEDWRSRRANAGKALAGVME